MNQIRLGEHDYPTVLVTAYWIATDPEGYVLALHEAGRLGYVKPSDEWTNAAEPLTERLQEITHQMVEDGQIPAGMYGLEQAG